MTLAEKKATIEELVSHKNSSDYITPENSNIPALESLPNSYSEVHQQDHKEAMPLDQKFNSDSHYEKVTEKQSANPSKRNNTETSPQKETPKKVNLSPDHDRQQIAKYQHKTQKEIEREKAFRSNLMFFGSGTKAGQRNTEKERDLQFIPSNSDMQRQAMLNDLIGRIQPDQTLSETRTDQQSKKEFFNAQNQGAIYLNQRIQDPVSPYQLMAGTVLPAVLISGINSDLPGHIIAQIRENVFDTVHGRYLLVPQGTKLLGSYDNMISWGQDKVMLVWSRLIMPDGATIVLDNMPGVDVMGYAGLKDKVNNHYMKIASAILMSTFLSVGTRRIAGDVNDNDPTFEQEMASHASADINQAGQKIVTRHLNVPPTLEIRPGFPFNVMVNKDIILRPYEK